MSVYADTSFFASLYLRDIHSPDVWRRMNRKPAVWLTALHRAELTHAIERHVFLHAISPAEAEQVHAAFQRDRENGVWAECPVSEGAFETCSELGRRHGADLGTRTLDALHVASALELRADSFWTFDKRQAALARVVGLQTD
ncbi:MAG: type II toxin-antitoxin system VapC family toxin [Terriglobia bacterium]